MTDRLLDDQALQASAVVANNAMNRERQLAGVNSYTRELGFNPLDRLIARIGRQVREPVSVGWLDLCCGTGRALLQAAEHLAMLASATASRSSGSTSSTSSTPHRDPVRLSNWCAPPSPTGSHHNGST